MRAQLMVLGLATAAAWGPGLFAQPTLPQVVVKPSPPPSSAVFEPLVWDSMT